VEVEGGRPVRERLRRIWLQVQTSDVERAMAHLKEAGTPVRDELEPLGDSPGHWISDPAGNILLVSQKGVESTLIPAG
jgi:hypothetical protein